MEGGGIGGENEEFMDHVGASRVRFYMPAEGPDIRYLKRGIRRDLVLLREVSALNIGGLEIRLDATQGHTASVDNAGRLVDVGIDVLQGCVLPVGEYNRGLVAVIGEA